MFKYKKSRPSLSETASYKVMKKTLLKLELNRYRIFNTDILPALPAG